MPSELTSRYHGTMCIRLESCVSVVLSGKRACESLLHVHRHTYAIFYGAWHIILADAVDFLFSNYFTPVHTYAQLLSIVLSGDQQPWQIQVKETINKSG